MKKYYRLKKNTDFQRLFKKGKRIYSPCITFIYYPSKTLTMGISVSKKHGKATRRNRIKRLIRAAFYKCCGRIEGTYSIIIKPTVAQSYTLAEFEKSLLVCFKKLNSWAKN